MWIYLIIGYANLGGKSKIIIKNLGYFYEQGQCNILLFSYIYISNTKLTSVEWMIRSKIRGDKISPIFK